MEEKILTQHPKGKNGVNILKRRYDIIRAAILNLLQDGKAMRYLDLSATIEQQLQGTFDGKVAWYVVAVKQDLEARDIIEIVPKKSPQELRKK